MTANLMFDRRNYFEGRSRLVAMTLFGVSWSDVTSFDVI